jgi:outer membrane protein
MRPACITGSNSICALSKEEVMRKSVLLISLIFMLSIPTISYAFGIEIAGGAWYQSPQGNLSYDKISSDDNLDLEDDLNYDDKWQPLGRVKIDMPLLIPNIYLMYTPMKWDEKGQKDVNFNFGGETFNANVDFDSKLKMNHLDVALYYGIPLIETATLDILNIDLGLNARLFDFEAEIKQDATDLKESESYLVPIPMLYAGMQIKPFDLIALEFEGRGIGYRSDYYYSLIGRFKMKPFGPVFAAAGYRFDKLDIDYQDVEVDGKFHGPFVEIGLEF